MCVGSRPGLIWQLTLSTCGELQNLTTFFCNSPFLLSSRQKDKVNRSGADGEFAKILARQKVGLFSREQHYPTHSPDQLSGPWHSRLCIPCRWWKIWESSNCQMVRMADNLSSQVNLGRLSISECLSTLVSSVMVVVTSVGVSGDAEGRWPSPNWRFRNL